MTHSQNTRDILVSSALPYANGTLHIGHLYEYLLSDVWVRMMRMSGHSVCYVCADDAHGTPIMIHALQKNVQPEALIDSIGQEFRRLFQAFHISFDSYHTTHSEENRLLAERFFKEFEQNGWIEEREIEQFYDPEQKLFLPDRFVKGTCPSCGAEDQNGDSCDACGATYAPSDLINARSVISGSRPERRRSKHLFFKLSQAEEPLQEWMKRADLQPQVRNKVQEWFAEGLKNWDISRDAPYFGFEIPGHPQRFFYVWLDAPIGYLASFKKFCDQTGLNFEDYTRPDSSKEMVHFIGKDILYFHTLFWPAMLHAAGVRQPNAVYAHGFVTAGGQKMSKSRGQLIGLSAYLQRLPAEYLRYYLARRANGTIDDISWNEGDFQARINAELVGKLSNIASRCGRLIQQTGGKLAQELCAPELYQTFLVQAEAIVQAYESRQFNKVCGLAFELADQANAYINAQKPWTLVRTDPEQACAIATVGVNLFRCLVIYLQPILPKLAERTAHWLQEQASDARSVYLWQDLHKPKLASALPELKQHFYQPITDAQKRALDDQHGEDDESPQSENTLDIETFAKMKLKVATVLEAEKVAESTKLLKLKVCLGDETRQIFAGIQGSYEPEALVGTQVVIVANLKSRKMRFGVSQGMVLAAGDSHGVYLIRPDTGARDGQDVC